MLQSLKNHHEKVTILQLCKIQVELKTNWVTVQLLLELSNSNFSPSALNIVAELRYIMCLCNGTNGWNLMWYNTLNLLSNYSILWYKKCTLFPLIEAWSQIQVSNRSRGLPVNTLELMIHRTVVVCCTICDVLHIGTWLLHLRVKNGKSQNL